jgi:uncharacterized membrane protein YphA (DoxX/SURF4 family)
MKTASHTTHGSVELVGTQPWLPAALARWSWWTRPVRAEIYAVLRIGVAAVLLLDQWLTMLPQLNALFGDGSTGAPSMYAWMFERPHLHWSLLQKVVDPQAISLMLTLWMGATVGLLIGWNTRLCAIVVWVLAVSFTNLNIYAINAGDHIRGILLLYLMLVPCGAAWSLDAWLHSRGNANSTSVAARQVQAHPWALRLLLIQLAWMYCTSGLCKLSGENWLAGNSLYYVMHDLSLTRFSADLLPMPYWLTQLATWSVLVWELTFPLLILFRRTRVPALLAGVMMHVGIFVTMELGCFPLYLLVVYAALLLEQWQLRGECVRGHGVNLLSRPRQDHDQA